MIKLNRIQKLNPRDVNADRKYYVAAKCEGEITLEEMSANISDRCTLTETDILAAINALQHEMIRNLSNGKIVRFGSFGSFQVSLNSSGVDTPEQSSQFQVKGVRVNFRPGTRIQTNLRNLKYSLISE